ncbi:Wadjet anti-phage system protein JetA family protein [Neptuniibacter halophilus]|uniref:Wadjet anti-phage system protein JetA family protein n=1 Tax=Neptuniibacter halophilus TaxID=651666 RepID=UPI0025743263|nr:Wadjet anti-phage system protein JetA family protein [Neptuniibacter halophilus]
MLFNKLPEDLFLPLSGQNRQVYQAVLISLADLFFDEDLVDPFVPKDLVRSTIEGAVIRLGVRRWEPEADDTEEEARELPRSAAEYTSRIYRRLVSTGWLEEEQRIYRTYVLLSPANSFLLRTLVSIANLEKRSYGGAVLNVLSSLEAAINDPQGRGITLSEAAQTAADFSAHLTDMMLGLRELKITLSETNNPQEIVRNFFERFVEHILVSDYKTLKTKNNPFRFRQQILSLLRELQFDTLKLEQLIVHYQQQFEVELHDAEARVHQHINRIIRIFESVDQRLAIIDDFRYRLEKRVSDTVRYMDKTTPGMASRLSRVIAAVSEKDGREIPRIRTLETVGFIAPGSIRTPVQRKTPAEPRVITRQEIDPKVLHLRQLFKEYKERREVKVDRIEAYLERHLIGRDQVDAVDFEIDSIEDYICFSYVRHMQSLGKKARKTIQRYQIQFREDYVSVADMVECRNFSITRKDHSKDVSDAR